MKPDSQRIQSLMRSVITEGRELDEKERADVWDALSELEEVRSGTVPMQVTAAWLSDAISSYKFRDAMLHSALRELAVRRSEDK